MGMRAVVYISVLLLFAAAVRVRQNFVLRERGSSPPTFFGEWEKNGKPVVVVKVKRRDIPVYRKLTLKRGKNGFYGYAPGEIAGEMKPGQKAYYYSEKKKVPGKIESVSRGISLESGMYKVRASFSCGKKCAAERVVAYVNTGRIADSVMIDPDSLVWGENGYYVWVAEGGKAFRRKVEIKQRAEGIIVMRGLKNGDNLISRGFSNLYEGDRIMPVEEGPGR